MIPRLRRWWQRARDESGQATVEYAAVTVAMLGGGVLSWPFFLGLINAFQTYYHSIYYVLQLPIT